MQGLGRAFSRSRDTRLAWTFEMVYLQGRKGCSMTAVDLFWLLDVVPKGCRIEEDLMWMVRSCVSKAGSGGHGSVSVADYVSGKGKRVEPDLLALRMVESKERQEAVSRLRSKLSGARLAQTFVASATGNSKEDNGSAWAGVLSACGLAGPDVNNLKGRAGPARTEPYGLDMHGKRLWKSFCFVDSNGSGMLSLQELEYALAREKVLSRLAARLGDAAENATTEGMQAFVASVRSELATAFARADRNASKHINWTEYLRLFEFASKRVKFFLSSIHVLLAMEVE